MPYDPDLADRLQAHFLFRPDMEEKKMFGGIGWMYFGNMCLGVYKDNLIIRIGKEAAEKIKDQPFVRPMDITGKPMAGWAMIEPEGIAEDADLMHYCTMALAFVATLPAK